MNKPSIQSDPILVEPTFQQRQQISDLATMMPTDEILVAQMLELQPIAIALEKIVQAFKNQALL